MSLNGTVSNPFSMLVGSPTHIEVLRAIGGMDIFFYVVKS
jgi:hypothetical protein